MKENKSIAARMIVAFALGAICFAALAEDWDALVKDVQKQQATPDASSTAVSQTGDGHPKIAIAIRELDDAIRYLESSPQDFSGQKMKAIDDSRKALASLRAALGADLQKK